MQGIKRAALWDGPYEARTTNHEPLTTSHYPHSLRQGDDGGYGGYADGDVGLTVGFIDFFLVF